MGRKNKGGHTRKLGGNTEYRLIRHMDEGISKQVLEHRYVMEKHLNRKLLTSEIVHHIDGDGLNNDISNLELMSQGDHRSEHSGPFKWNLEEGLILHNSGVTDTDIAIRFGVSQTAVSKAFRRRGIKANKRNPRDRKFDWDKAIALHKEGFTATEIGQRFGVTRQAIRNVLNKNAL